MKDARGEEVEAKRRRGGGVKGRKKLKVENCSFRRLYERLKGEVRCKQIQHSCL
jgi:hypothetical protein